MNATANRDGLKDALESVIALESELDQRITRVLDQTRGYLEAPGMIDGLQPLATGHLQALQSHIEQLVDTDGPSLGSWISAGYKIRPEGRGEREAVAALRALAGALTECAFAYAVVHAVAHRAYQVETANLADEHRMAYLTAAQAIHRAVGDAAVQELQESGYECACECPSCGPGICLCWHVHADPQVGGEAAPTEGIVVRRPRPGSNAERAGLHHGDVILAVADEEVGSYQNMLDRMREQEPGQEVWLRVRQRDGKEQEVILIR